MNLTQFLTKDLIFLNLQSTGRDDTIEEIITRMAEVRPELSKHQTILIRKLIQREEIETTALDTGVAIPHCRFEEIEQPVVSIARSNVGVRFNETGQLVYLFFTIISPRKQPAMHLRILAQVAHLVKNKNHVNHLMKARNEDEIYSLMQSWGSEQ